MPESLLLYAGSHYGGRVDIRWYSVEVDTMAGHKILLLLSPGRCLPVVHLPDLGGAPRAANPTATMAATPPL